MPTILIVILICFYILSCALTFKAGCKYKLNKKPKNKNKVLNKADNAALDKLKRQEFIFWHYDGTENYGSYPKRD